MGVFVETIFDILGGQKHFDLVDLFLVQVSFALQLFDLLLSLFLMTGKFKLSLVAPKDIWLSLGSSLGKHIMKVGYLIEPSITDNHEERPVVHFDAIFNQNSNAVVNFLFHFIKECLYYFKIFEEILQI